MHIASLRMLVLRFWPMLYRHMPRVKDVCTYQSEGFLLTGCFTPVHYGLWVRPDGKIRASSPSSSSSASWHRWLQMLASESRSGTSEREHHPHQQHHRRRCVSENPASSFLPVNQKIFIAFQADIETWANLMTRVDDVI